MMGAAWRGQSAAPSSKTQRQGLPPESLPALLELLDARGLASLRRACALHGAAREAHVAMLYAAVLELLLETKFPFTHAAYVLGLNGPYFSLDTIAERHYGIPEALPALICELFRVAVPGVAFTTLRLQKFAAAANFGGRHRTLAFSLASPPPALTTEDGGNADGARLGATELAGAAAEAGTMDEAPLLVSTGPGLPGYVLCLTEGCHGGHGEVCEDLGKGGSWRWLSGPQLRTRWAAFPADAWLRWHWPHEGDLYAVTVTCEAPANYLKLRRRECKQMAGIGFLLPADISIGPEDEADENIEEADGDSSQSPDAGRVDPDGARSPVSPSRRPSGARVAAARRLLGLADEPMLTAPLVEDAFRRAARQVHPDRAAADTLIPASWLMSQLTWARRVLREAAADGEGEQPAEQEAAAEILMLAAPDPQ